jgi:hypothetical protein
MSNISIHIFQNILSSRERIQSQQCQFFNEDHEKTSAALAYSAYRIGNRYNFCESECDCNQTGPLPHLREALLVTAQKQYKHCSTGITVVSDESHEQTLALFQQHLPFLATSSTDNTMFIHASSGKTLN